MLRASCVRASQGDIRSAEHSICIWLINRADHIIWYQSRSFLGLIASTIACPHPPLPLRAAKPIAPLPCPTTAIKRRPPKPPWKPCSTSSSRWSAILASAWTRTSLQSARKPVSSQPPSRKSRPRSWTSKVALTPTMHPRPASRRPRP